MDNIRILVCDDHELVRSGIIQILRNANFVIAGEAADGCQMLREYIKMRPDIVLADLSMPGLSGLDASKEILKIDSSAKILLVTMYSEEHNIVSAYFAGVKGLIGKDVTKEEMISAIIKITEGEIYFGQAYTSARIIELAARYRGANKTGESDPGNLTGKEKAVLQLFAEGLMSSEIADKLKVSKKAVDSYRHNIMQKFNLRSFPALIKFAIENQNFKNTA